MIVLNWMDVMILFPKQNLIANSMPLVNADLSVKLSRQKTDAMIQSDVTGIKNASTLMKYIVKLPLTCKNVAKIQMISAILKITNA